MEEIILSTRTQLQHLIIDALGDAIAQQDLAPHPSKERLFRESDLVEYIERGSREIKKENDVAPAPYLL